MGTTVSVTAGDAAGVAATQAWFAEVERTCSRFVPDSDLSLVNAAPGTVVAVPPALLPVLQAAEQAKEMTDGLVDAGVGGDVIRWGYDRSFELVPADVAGQIEAETPQRWRLDGDWLLRLEGTHLDLGGVAKGWAADRAVAAGMASIVSAGGDVASRSPDCRIEVEAPEGDVVVTVPLGCGALATSSRARRHWTVDGEAAHHLIDPRTSRPADTPIVSATVVARSAVAAEAGAKAVLLLGVDGLAWAARQPWIRGALAIWDDGNVYATGGLEIAA